MKEQQSRRRTNTGKQKRTRKTKRYLLQHFVNVDLVSLNASLGFLPLFPGAFGASLHNRLLLGLWRPSRFLQTLALASLLLTLCTFRWSHLSCCANKKWKGTFSRFQAKSHSLCLPLALARSRSLSPSHSRSLCSRLLSGARNKSDRVTDREQKRGNGRLGNRAGNEARIQTSRVSRHLRSLFPSLGPPPPAHHVGWMMMVCGRKTLFFVVFLSHS